MIYGFSHCYLRLSSSSFSLSDLVSREIHLCNHSVQKEHTKPLVDHEDEDTSSDENMMQQSEFIDYLGSIGATDEQISRLFSSICSTCCSAVSAASDRMTRVGDGFEWLGVDLMVTESFETLLIEVNVSPDISPSTSITAPLVKAAVNDLFVLLLDEGALKAVMSNKSPARFHLDTLSDYGDAYRSSSLQWRPWLAEHTCIKEMKAEAVSFEDTYSAKLLEESLPAIRILTGKKAPEAQVLMTPAEAALVVANVSADDEDEI